MLKFIFYFTQVITTAGTFWMYAVLCALGVVFVIFCVPETKGRSTDEIAKIFDGRTEESNEGDRPKYVYNAVK